MAGRPLQSEPAARGGLAARGAAADTRGRGSHGRRPRPRSPRGARGGARSGGGARGRPGWPRARRAARPAAPRLRRAARDRQRNPRQHRGGQRAAAARGAAPTLIVGQAIELWRGPLAAALRERRAAPLREAAARQFEAGADALDLNLGDGGGAADEEIAGGLAWAAEAIRAARPSAALWLDCGRQEALALAIGRVAPPSAANAAFPGAPGCGALLEACAAAGAGAVVSPARSAAADPRAPLAALIAAAGEARAAMAAAGIGEAWFDCLALPPPVAAGRALALVRALAADRGARPRLRPLLAAGNLAHARGADGRRPPPPVRRALVALYAACAAGAGAEALIAPAAQPSLRAAVAVASGARGPRGEAERWLLDAARASAEGGAAPPPPAALAAARPALAEARALLFGSG